jgi:DNA-directed RNA polymerase specialized sigma subunit
MNVQDDLQHQKNEENIQKVWKVIGSNRHLTIHELEEEAGISKTMYHEILTENLGMHFVAAISVPLMLSEDQKLNRVDVSKDLVNRENTDEKFLKNIVTDEKNWLHCYDV